MASVSRAQGVLIGRLADVGVALRDQASQAALTENVVRTSEIEGEQLSAASVRSSIARRLGVDIGALDPVDRHVEGFVGMVLGATANCAPALSQERLFGWHASLFPTGYSGLAQIRSVAGATMPVAPCKWSLAPSVAGGCTSRRPRRSVWRLRCVASFSGSTDGSPQRFYSVPAQIQRERGAYYQILERIQKAPMDVSEWLGWFLTTVHRAVDEAQLALDTVLSKARFWQRWASTPLNERQVKLLNRVLDGFEGKLTSSKWAAIAKCSPDTALRDINDLLAKGLLKRSSAGGRSSSYELGDPTVLPLPRSQHADPFRSGER